MTAVGGTRLVVNKANQRVREVAWNDLRWLTPDNGGGAGGGGFSSFHAQPPYQQGDPFGGRRRTVPDIAVHASMLPGYPVVLGGHWVTDAGTSAATPLAATAFALLSGSQRAAGRPPLGPVNGLVYWLGRHARWALYDVVTGATGYYPSVPPRRATLGYDLATGWGVPRFSADHGGAAVGYSPALNWALTRIASGPSTSA